jgi:hypothetical protein
MNREIGRDREGGERDNDNTIIGERERERERIPASK